MYPTQNADIVREAGGLSSVCTAELMTPTTYAILDALSGISTRTTPTLTPTTLKCIEETFQDLVATNNNPTHDREAGFIPPSVPLMSASKTQQVVYVVSEGNVSRNRSSARRASISSNSSCSSDATVFTSKPRRGGGRRKEDREKESELPKEEQEKRRIRRERNKLAAARCRKRRLDLTTSLEQETEELEDKKHSLQKEIRQLLREKEELESVLDSHTPRCKAAKLISSPKKPLEPLVVKQETDESNDAYLSEDTEPELMEKFVKPLPKSRPTTLAVAPLYSPKEKNTFEIAGVAITTPSSGIPGFSFDSLLESGTGLTPVVSCLSPLCATQQRSFLLPVDLSSPEAATRKLVSL